VNPVDDQIARLRAATGAQSDAQLADALGIRPGAVANWRTRQKIPAASLLRAAERLEVRVEWIRNGDPTNRKDSTYRAPQEECIGVREPPPAPARIDGRPGDLALAECSGERRLDQLQDWLATWWGIASEQQRSALERQFPAWLRGLGTRKDL
jgi:transcriptional regulator with XRE-family HTH domain